MNRSSSADDQLLEGGLRIGYKTDRYDVAGFVRNITNDESAVSAIDFNNSRHGQRAPHLGRRTRR
jgi:hypothetical protein